MQRLDCNFQKNLFLNDNLSLLPLSSLFMFFDRIRIHHSIMAKKSRKTKTKGTKDAAIEHSQETQPISSSIALPDNETQGGKWDLKHIYDMDQLQGEEPTLCDGNNCRLVACSQWMCSLSGNIWNGCLDCQLERFQGWPKSKEDYPVEFISDDHRRVMIQHCCSELVHNIC